MGETRKTRTAATLKARSQVVTNSQTADDHILLARGLSARMTGANIPLVGLTQEEMERDLRHMEAFANACIAYAQQYYIYHNQTVTKDQKEDGGGATSSTSTDVAMTTNNKSSTSNSTIIAPQPITPLIAMPVRIDPEEEKRLQNLRQKIQQCEAQREVYEGQYLSLRAHYIYLSQKLKCKREDVNKRFGFLQQQVNKRGKLVALQRVRLQILRDSYQCLLYREKFGIPASTGSDAAELYTTWNEIEKEWKKAEEDCGKGSTSGSGSSIIRWSASHIPKIPPGVPLLLSQLAEQPGQAAAWCTSGAFGAKPDSLLWIENQVPTGAPDTTEELRALREEEALLKEEIQQERSLNKEFQTDVIVTRQKNDELVAMMALLRTETEAAIARHNILLESDIAKNAAIQLHENDDEDAEPASSTMKKATNNQSSSKEAVVRGSGDTTPAVTGSRDSPSPLPESSGLKEDDENDGDDEGGAEEEDDEGEIMLEEGPSKRALETENDSSARSKRRKL